MSGKRIPYSDPPVPPPVGSTPFVSPGPQTTLLMGSGGKAKNWQKINLSPDMIERIAKFADQIGATSFADAVKMLLSMALSSQSDIAALAHSRQRALFSLRRDTFGDLAKFFEEQSKLYKLKSEEEAALASLANPIQSGNQWDPNQK